jgi:hypothetical protein
MCRATKRFPWRKQYFASQKQVTIDTSLYLNPYIIKIKNCSLARARALCGCKTFPIAYIKRKTPESGGVMAASPGGDAVGSESRFHQS